MIEAPGRSKDTWLRAFVAIGLSDGLRERLAKCAERLRRAGGRVSWIPPDNLHVTLVFLGDIPSDSVPRITRVLDRITVGESPFDVTCQGLGTFGAPHSPRIIWAGLNDREGRLTHLQAATSAALEAEGFQIEKRPFHPHVTLGRVRSRAGLRGLTSLLPSDNNTPFGEVVVQEVWLMRSHLGAGGPRYEKLHVSGLKGAKGT